MSFSNEHRNPQFVRRRLRHLRHCLLALCLAGLGVILLAGPAAAAPADQHADRLGEEQRGRPRRLPAPGAGRHPGSAPDRAHRSHRQGEGEVERRSHDQARLGQRQGSAGRRPRRCAVAALTSGKLHVKWQLSGEIDGIDFGPTTIDKDNVTCDPKLSGGGFECEADSPGLPLPGCAPLAAPAFFVAKLVHRRRSSTSRRRAPSSPAACRSAGTASPGPDDLLAHRHQRRARRFGAVHGEGRRRGRLRARPVPLDAGRRPRPSRSKFKIVEALDPLGITELFEIVDDRRRLGDRVEPELRPHRRGLHAPRWARCSRTTSSRRSPRSARSPGQEGSRDLVVRERQLAVPDRLVRVGVLERHEVLRALAAARVRRQRRLRRPADGRPTSPGSRRRRASRSTSRT